MAAPAIPGVGWVLHERARRHAFRGAGDLSLKSFSGGAARYRVAGPLLVGPDSYLILNAGQEYAVEVDSPAPVESLCVFFAPGFVEGVARTFTAPAETLLADPARPGGPVEFAVRTHPHDEVVTPALRALRASLLSAEREPGALEERLHRLAEALLLRRAQTAREIAALPARRPATRAELYRRLHIARDYLSAELGRPLGLAEIGRTAGLSPNHLLRGYRTLFGRTPHQHLIELRLARAAELLRAGDDPVSEICLAVGFSSLGSFSALFRRRMGRSPLAYRREIR